MKAKLKFDKTLVLGFFLRHGEKIAFAAVVVAAVALIYTAMGGQKFDKSPEDLIRKADDATTAIKNAPSEVKEDVVQIGSQIKAASGEIQLGPYAFTKPLDELIYVPKTLRGEPVLCSVEELRGLGGLARFEQTGLGMPGAAAPGAPQPALGQRWAVVTGIVDNEKLRKAFYDCFKNTRKHDDSDFVPVYRGFYVQRAEVTDENEPLEDLKWEQPYVSWLAEYNRYPARGNEVAELRFVDAKLVFPLPFRTDGQNWGKEVVHPPKIPVAVVNQLGPGTPSPDDPNKQPASEGADPFGGEGPAGGVGRGMGMEGPGGYGPRGPAGGMAGGMVGPEGMERAMGPYGGRMGAYGGRMDGFGSAAGQANPVLLFRFFDYNVQPGKRYRYRVKIVVTNPNYRYPAQDLVKELGERMKDPKQWTDRLVSDWSDPSDVVCVPRDDRWLAGLVLPPPEEKDREPRGSVVAIHWDYQKGEEVHDEFEVSRGWLANFFDQKAPVAGPQSALPGGPGMMMGPAGMGPPPGGAMGPEPRRPGREGRTSRRNQPQPPIAQPQVVPETVDYVTEMLVLDLRGGEKLAGRNRLTSPGEILLLDPDGNLEVRDDVEDGRARRRQTNPVAAPGGGVLPGGPGIGGPPGMMHGPAGPGIGFE